MAIWIQVSDASRAVGSGGASGDRPPHLKSVPPHFMFGPPVAAYIQYCILKMCPPLLVFGPSVCFLALPAAKFWRRAWMQVRRLRILSLCFAPQVIRDGFSFS